MHLKNFLIFSFRTTRLIRKFLMYGKYQNYGTLLSSYILIPEFKDLGK